MSLKADCTDSSKNLCAIQLISHRVNAKIAPTSIKEVKETRLSSHAGLTNCYHKLHRVNRQLRKRWRIRCDLTFMYVIFTMSLCARLKL